MIEHGVNDTSKLSEIIDPELINFLGDFGISDIINYNTDKKIFFKRFIDKR